MPIDPNAIGAKTKPNIFEWTDRDTLLYALGVGSVFQDLAFTTENSHDTPQQVLPTYAVIACLPFAGQLLGDLTTAPGLSILGVVYLGLVPTALAFSTWAYALSHTTAGKLGVTTFAVPPITIVLGWLLLGEVPPVLAIVGGALSLLGVAIARMRPRVRVASGR